MGDEKRTVDTLPAQPQTRQMKLLNLGMCRTGTMSMKAALEKLGYKVWHMSTAMEQGPSFLASMQEATRAHYGLDPNRKPWGRAEFDALLGDCDVILDVPLCCFVDELVAAYPEAKVLLTERDADAWIRSMDKTVWVVHGWGKSWDVVAGWHPIGAGLWGLMKLLSACWEDEAARAGLSRKEAFIAHYEYVKKTVPKEKLLCHRSAEGWEPLCKFLDKPVPAEPYPNVNDAALFVKLHAQLWWVCLASMLAKTVLAPLAVVGFGVGWWHWVN